MGKISLRKFILIVSMGFFFLGGHSLYQRAVAPGGHPKYPIEVTPDRVFNSTIPLYTYQLVAKYRQPSSDWFVQGIYYHGEIYQSVGLWGKSKLVKWRLEEGRILNVSRLAKKYFAEDITLLNGRLYQLTYDTNLGFVYDPDSLETIDSFTYSTQGWGLTTDGTYLIRSDGSSTIYFMDANTYQIVKTITVHDAAGSISNINAMDYMTGKIYANIYLTPFIAEISPDNGNVTAWISLEGLNDTEYDVEKHHVPNGITHIGKDFLVSGKNWSAIYQISLIPQILEKK